MPRTKRPKWEQVEKELANARQELDAVEARRGELIDTGDPEAAGELAELGARAELLQARLRRLETDLAELRPERLREELTELEDEIHRLERQRIPLAEQYQEARRVLKAAEGALQRWQAGPGRRAEDLRRRLSEKQAELRQAEEEVNTHATTV